MFMSPFVAEQGGPPVGPGPWYTGPWPAPYDGVPPIDPTNVVAAYQPKWAVGSIYERTDTATYANSLVNTADSGVNDAMTGMLPTWDAVNGWNGTGYSYLIAPFTMGASQNQAIIGAYSHANITAICNITAATTTGDLTRVSFNNVGGGRFLLANCSGNVEIAGYVNTGVLGFTGTNVFFNGTSIGSIGAVTGNVTDAMYILAINTDGVMQLSSFVRIKALAYYNTRITDLQAQAVSAAMEVIRAA